MGKFTDSRPKKRKKLGGEYETYVPLDGVAPLLRAAYDWLREDRRRWEPEMIARSTTGTPLTLSRIGEAKTVCAIGSVVRSVWRATGDITGYANVLVPLDLTALHLYECTIAEVNTELGYTDVLRCFDHACTMVEQRGEESAILTHLREGTLPSAPPTPTPPAVTVTASPQLQLF